jgi:hypothetical protein
MKKIITAILKIIENRKIARDFKQSIFGGVRLFIKGEDVDKIYDLQEYESISRNGPYLLPVRGIKSEVYNWCHKIKNKVHVADEFRNDFGAEEFYFKRRKDAEKFKKAFNLNAILEFNGQDLSKVNYTWKFSYPTGILQDVIHLSFVFAAARLGVYLAENAKF